LFEKLEKDNKIEDRKKKVINEKNNRRKEEEKENGTKTSNFTLNNNAMFMVTHLRG
jgi:hypothetical protein